MPDHVVLHLSDLYFHSDEHELHNTKRALFDKLIVKIKELGSFWKPTVLVVSGDIAYYGTHNDYDIAYEWFIEALEELKIPPHCLVLAPGNHDLNYSHPLYNGMLTISKEEQPQLMSDKLLTMEQLDLISTPFSDFEEFCWRLGMEPYKLGTKNSFLCGVKIIDHLQFLIFNTAWHYNTQGNVNASNLGKLFMGLSFWDTILAQNINPSSELRNMAVWHHPPEYLHASELQESGDRRALFMEIAKYADLILNGHAHVGPKQSNNTLRTLPLFVSGSDQDSSQCNNFANLYRLPFTEDQARTIYLFSAFSEDTWEEGSYPNEILSLKTKKSHLRQLSEVCLQNFTSQGGRFEHLKIDLSLLPSLKKIKEPFYDDFGNLQTDPLFHTNADFESSNLIETVENLWKEDCRHFSLTGEGGIGKTCSLLYLWKEFLQDPGKPIPIYIPLNEYNYFEQNSPSIPEYLISKIKEYYLNLDPQSNLSNEDIKQVFFDSKPFKSQNNRIKFLFLLDSYYEISKERKELLQEISIFSQSLDSVQFIVACRYDFRKEDGHFSEWHGFTLNPLDEAIIRQHIKAKEVTISPMRKAKQENLLSVLKTPMNLTIYSNSYWLMKEYPSANYKRQILSKGELYWNFFEALYQLLQSEYPVKNKGILPYRFTMHHLLPALAYEMQQRGSCQVSEDLMIRLISNLTTEFQNKIQDHWCQCFNCFSQDEWSKTPNLTVSQDEIHQSLIDLVEKDMVIFQRYSLSNKLWLYGFSHENFRDAFAAMHILNECHFCNVQKKGPSAILNKSLNHSIMSFIGEMDGIHNTKPFTDKKLKWKCKTLGRSIIWKQLEACKEKFDGSTAKKVYHLIETIFCSRKELSGLDLSSLDLSQVKLKSKICSRSQEFVTQFDHSILRENMVLSYGHISSVRSVAFSPDGKTCLSGSGDRSLKLWDIQTGACIRTFIGHDHFIRSIAFSPDGKTCLSGSWDNTLKLWDTNSGDCILTFTGHQYFVRSVAFSPDGKTCISGSWDQSIKLWDTLSGICIRTFLGHEHFVRCVAFTPDGKTIISSSWDNVLKLWDVASSECISTISTNEHSFGSIAVSPDGKTCLCGSEDKTFFLWDIHKGLCLGSFRGHASSVRSVVFSPDGRRCLSGSADRTLKLWDVSSMTCITTLIGHNHSVESVAISPDQTQCISGSVDRSLRLWDLPAGNCLRTFTGFDHTVRAVSISQDSQFCLSGADDKSIKLWDTKSGKCIQTFLGHDDSVSSVAFHPLANEVLSASWDYSLKLWDLNSGICLKTILGHNNSVLCCAFSPDGKTCLSGSWDNTIKWWDLETATCKRTYKGHTSSVHAIAFSPDGKTCLSGSWDNTMKWWYLESSLCLRTFSGHFFFVRSVAFSPDGKTCLSGSEDNTLKLWDLHTGECLRTFLGHSYHVRSVVFSPDGKTCLSGSGDNTIKLWDIQSGSCLMTLEDHKHSVRSVVFSPDGKTCLSGSKDRTIKLWDLSSGKVLWSGINITGLYMHNCSLKDLHPDSLFSEKSISLLKLYKIKLD
jgi:WD40 repeat protein